MVQTLYLSSTVKGWCSYRPYKGTTEERYQQDSELHYGLTIQSPDESDSEPENNVPTFCIDEMNEWLSLWVSDAKNCMYHMDEDYSLLKHRKGISINNSEIKRAEKEARYKLIKKMHKKMLQMHQPSMVSDQC